MGISGLLSHVHVHDHHQIWMLFFLCTCGFASIDARRVFNDDGL